jgi:hypothetical protein
MSYGLCCVTEPRSRTALQLDILIEIPPYLIGRLFLSRFAAETLTDSGGRSFPQLYLTTLQPEQGAMSNSEP